jgi:hypothetical protein
VTVIWVSIPVSFYMMSPLCFKSTLQNHMCVTGIQNACCNEILYILLDTKLQSVLNTVITLSEQNLSIGGLNPLVRRDRPGGILNIENVNFH